MKNCDLLKYGIRKEPVETNNTLDIQTPLKIKGEYKLYEWLKSHFTDMSFISKISPSWASSYVYDCGSTKYKVMIESDGPEHYSYMHNFGNINLKEFQKVDKKKNKLAIDNGYTIIRIYQNDILENNRNWEYTLFNYLNNIKSGNIKNVFMWFGSNKQSHDTYKLYFDELYPDFNISNITDDQIEKKIEQDIKKDYKMPDIPIKDVVTKIFDILNDLYPSVSFEKLFKPKWLDKKRSFSIGCSSHKCVFVVDSDFFDNFYKSEPIEKRKKELDKTVAAIRNKYRCIRIYHKLVQDELYLRDAIKSKFDQVISQRTQNITYIDTKINEYNDIYDDFVNKASLYS